MTRGKTLDGIEPPYKANALRVSEKQERDTTTSPTVLDNAQ